MPAVFHRSALRDARKRDRAGGWDNGDSEKVTGRAVKIVYLASARCRHPPGGPKTIGDAPCRNRHYPIRRPIAFSVHAQRRSMKHAGMALTPLLFGRLLDAGLFAPLQTAAVQSRSAFCDTKRPCCACNSLHSKVTKTIFQCGTKL